MKLGEYELLDLLGRGGMGAVYRARHPTHGDMVAVKVMTGVYDESDLRRFVREANAGVAVSHENVIRVLEAGAHAGRPFIVLELAPGGSLADRLDREKRLPWADVARLGVAIARGLGAVHAAGLIHRDLKPGNVLIARDGTPKLADFGLVKKLDGASSLTASSVVVGTPQFMSPEQLDGQPVAASSDLYSLGGLLFALLAGEPPFVGSGFAVFKRIMKETPASVRSIVPEVPPELDALVARLLEKSPRARGTIAEAEAVLQALLLRAAKPPEKEPAPRSRAFVGVVAAAGLACALLAAALALTRSPPAELPPPPSPPPETALVASGVVPAPGPFAYASLPLSTAEVAPGSSSSLRIIWAHGRTRFAHAAALAAVVYSPDGRLIASHDGESQAFVWDAATGELVNVADGPSHVTAIAFEADGPGLLVARRDGTVASILSGTGPARRFAHVTPPACAIWWSTKGGAAYLATENGGVLRVPTAPGGYSGESVGPIIGGVMKSAAFSRDGQRVAFISAANRCVVRSMGGDGPFLIQEGVAAVAFVPGDSLRCLLVSKGEARLYDPRSPRSSSLLGQVAPGEVVRAATATEDGKKVAIGGTSLAVFDLASGDRILLSEGEAGVTALAFSPDGSRLSSGDEGRRIRRWDVARATLIDRADERDGPGRVLAASGDGRRIAIARWNGAIVLLDTATGEAVTVWRAARPIGALAMAHGGSIGLACDDEGVGQVFDAVRGARGAVLGPTARGPVTRGPSIAGVDGDGTFAVIAGNGRDAAGYDLPLGRLRFQLPLRSGVSFATSPLSRDATRVVVAGSDELVFWDPRSSTSLGSVAEPGVLHCTIDPGGERVASARIVAGGTEVTVRRFGTGEVLRGPIRVGVHFPSSMAFLDENTLAYAGAEVFALVDLRTGVVRDEVLKYAGVTEQVASVAPLDDGRVLVLTRRGLVLRCARTE